MALDLSLNITQSNDATYLTFTDDAGTYNNPDNLDGWGSPNAVVTDIVASTTTTALKNHLLLTVVVTDKGGVETTYDDINLYDHDSTGPFTDVNDLTWTIDAADLVESSTAMGLATARLTDGIYVITYTLQDANTAVAVDTYNITMLVDGDVRADVFDGLRTISQQYDDEINDTSKTILDPLLNYAYLYGMNASATVSEQTNLINMLWTLDKLNSDGSKYTW